MNRMQFGSKGQSQGWSEETKQVFQNLNLWLAAQAEVLALTGVTGSKGVSQVYRELAERLGEFHRGGPAVLEDAVDKATLKASTLNKYLK